jgi:Beta-lactamase class C and other penicillin binding proteins
MDMAKKNEISIDAPVESFLPRELSIPQIGENQITLRHLATHTSGLPLTPLNVLPVDPWDTYAEYTAEDFYQALVDTDLASKPGSQFSYSSFGMGLLAHILSINSNKGIEKLYRSRLTNPLKMTRTASQMTDRINETRAQGYSYHIETLNHVNSVWPAFKSSASDMLKYLGANLGLVKSELYPAMIAAHEIQSNQGLVHFQQAFGWWRDMADGKI